MDTSALFHKCVFLFEYSVLSYLGYNCLLSDPFNDAYNSTIWGFFFWNFKLKTVQSFLEKFFSSK